MAEKKKALDRYALRKAYLTGKMEDYVGSEMAKGVDIDTKEVADFLKSVEGDRKKKIKSLAKYMPDEDKSPSVISTGKKLADEEKKEIFQNVKKAESILKEYKGIAKRANDRVVQGQMQNIGHELASLSLDVKRFRYLMYQKYMREMFRIWNEVSTIKSRKEAEDWASISAEFYDYKSAYALETACEDVMINCRKEFAKYN